MSVSITSPTSTTTQLLQNGSPFLTVDSSLNVTIPQGLSITGTATFAGGLNIDSGTLYVDNVNNYVGIGTTSPTQKLDISGSGIQRLAIRDTGGTAIGYLKAYQADVYIDNGSATGSLIFQTAAGNNRMYIDSSGNVGIGTASPTSRLSVLGGSLPTGGSGVSLSISSALGATRLTTDASNTTSFIGSYYDNTSLEISQGSTSAYVSGIVIGARSATNATVSDAIALFTRSVERMRIDGSGNVGIGTSSPSSYAPLSVAATTTNTNVGKICSVGLTAGDVGSAGMSVIKYDNNTTTSQIFFKFIINQSANGSGQINANGANACAFGTYSDARLKENIEPLPSQLDNILALKPSEFDYIESEGGGHQIGFIAQEMQEVYPDAVGERSDGMLTISGWDKTTARLVKAIQEQQAQIEELKAAIAELKA